MTAPPLSSRISFSSPGRVTVRTGKVELGQGIVAAMTRIAATALQVDPGRVTIPSANTDHAPNEGWTAGSVSIQIGGLAIRQACVQARSLLLARAAEQLGVEADRLDVKDGSVLLESHPTGLDYWSLSGALDDALFDPPPLPQSAEPPEGDIGRADLRAKVTGAAFIQDLSPTGLRHARVVRPPEPGARLEALDEAAFGADHPEAQLIVDGDFIAVTCDREEDALRAAERLTALAQWRLPPAIPHPGEIADWLPSLPAKTSALTLAPAGVNALTWHEATYSRPAIAHGSIGPSCGLAQMRDGRLRIWSHSQNIFALRDAIASVLGLDPATVDVEHVPSAGCYGHNGADDAAFDAALIALRSDGRPVRVQWSRADELGWAPVGAPMAVHIDAGLDDNGRIGAWRLELWTAPHARRPGIGGPNLLSATMLGTPTPLSPANEIPLPMGGGNRNAEALYNFPDHQVTDNFIADFPIRTSSLRSLGAHANVFAIESMMDELAALAGADPIAFRLTHLGDPRGRRVLEAVATLSGWGEAPVEDGRGRGVAVARYKSADGGYAAIVAEVAVDEDVLPTRVWCAVDVGRVVSRDGVINQIEGGIIQSLSWALREAAPLGPRGVEARSWKDYPILRFPETPEIVVALVGDPADPSVGAGEVVQGPATAAVANAVAAALGARVRRLPLSRERIIAVAAEA